MMRKSLLAVPALLLLLGCDAPPEFAPVPAAAPQVEPALLPVGQILAAADGGRITDQQTAALEARAESLRRRADRLRAQDLDR